MFTDYCLAGQNRTNPKCPILSGDTPKPDKTGHLSLGVSGFVRVSGHFRLTDLV